MLVYKMYLIDQTVKLFKLLKIGSGCLGRGVLLVQCIKTFGWLEAQVTGKQTINI